jgi:hypothetical protein
VTPTRYPTWRSLAFSIAILMLLSLVVMISRIRSWHLQANEVPAIRISLLSQLIVFAGALTLRRRPARGFLIFGAGFLVMAAALLILLPWERPLAVPVSALTMIGSGYTGLGVKQLAVDRG